MAHSINQKCIGCGACVKVCPAAVISGEKKGVHAIDAAGCIDCGACGRVCPTEAVSDANGVTCMKVKRSEWPKPGFDLELCMACSSCVEDCPVACLGLTAVGDGGDAKPYMAEGKLCLGCGICSEQCPVDAITMQ